MSAPSQNRITGHGITAARSQLIAVISHIDAGHLPAYHEAYVRAFAEAGAEVVSVAPWNAPHTHTPTRESISYRNWSHSGETAPGKATELAPSPIRSSFRRILDGRFRETIRATQNWRQVAKHVRRIEIEQGRSVDGVFLVYLSSDFLTSWLRGWVIDRILQTPWAGIIVGPSPADPLRPKNQRGAPERGIDARQCRGIVVNCEPIAGSCRLAWPDRSVVVMPEITNVSQPEREVQTQLRSASPTIGLLGNITLRKGVRLFVETARLAAVHGHPWRFLLAGDFSAQACSDADREIIDSLIANPPATLDFRPGRIPEGPVFNAHVAASDVIFAAYHDFPFHSNLLTKAATFGRPVLVSDEGIIGQITQTNGLGEILSKRTPEEALVLIQRLLRDSKKYQPALARYAEDNSHEHLPAVVIDLFPSVTTSPKSLK